LKTDIEIMYSPKALDIQIDKRFESFKNLLY